MIDKNSGHFCSLSGRSRQHIQHAHDLMMREEAPLVSQISFFERKQITATMIKFLALVLSALSLADASLLRRTRRVAFAGRIVDPVEEEERYVNSECIIVALSTVKKNLHYPRFLQTCS